MLPGVDRQQTEPLRSGDETSSLHTDFEQRRAIASVRMRLFGAAPTLAIGRYRIERRLGTGGMGEVYLGHDAALDRKAAIKRVRADLSSPENAERLRNEARVLARLSHPNVVQVYEVGEHEEQTFLAMEYVEGTTLTTWLKKASRSWQAILAVFLAAGRGLAAAHSAGVIHRDFKPDNVLISNDGRVCVADFGLAVAGEHEGVDEIAGTVRYMALEQLRGGTVDARSDQFGFCIALYEALWRQPPFDCASVASRERALEAGRPTPPPRGRAPRAVWQVVRRGLEREPDRRWPSFDQLLSALEAIPIRRRRRVVLALALPLALAAAWVVASDSPDERVCAGVATELAGVWDNDVEAKLAMVFAATEVAHAPTTLERMSQGLDAWAENWTNERLAQCEAARDGTDDEQLARARRACLENQRRRVEALVIEFGRADVDVVDHAVEAVARLPQPSACAAAELLEGPEPPPAELHDRVEQVRLELASAKSLRALGRGDLAALAVVIESARSLDYPPLLAEALAEQGRMEIDTGSLKRGLELLDEAAQLALASDHPRLLAETWIELALQHSVELPDVEQAARQLGLAEAAWARIGLDDLNRSRFLFVHGRLAARRNETERAREFYRDALALVGPLEVARVTYLSALAELADPEDRLELRRQVLQVAEEIYGPEHPSVALDVYNLAIVEFELGHQEAASALYTRAVKLWTEAHREPHENLARAHFVLGFEAMWNSDLDKAEYHARAMAEILAKTMPPEHVAHGDPEMGLARIAGARGDHAGAVTHARNALRYYELEGNPASPQVLAMRLDIASSLVALREFAEAEAEYQRVIELAGQDRAEHSQALVGLAELTLRQNRLADARRHLDEIEERGLEQLGEWKVGYTLLDLLVDLRRGCRRCADGAAERLAAARQEWNTPEETMVRWLVELEGTAAEAKLLGLPLERAGE
jgi:tetratricopeptide (TPR) repeat protein/predicted Ser/Thr protein kinase